MPGVTRNGKQQTLLATNIGRKSWIDWLDYVEGANDELPELTVLSKDLLDHPPVLPEQLIEGVLRCGHKMLISGSSKAGKSYLLMELCVALSEGIKWVVTMLTAAPMQKTWLPIKSIPKEPTSMSLMA